MKFIEIEDGLAINVDNIASIEDFRGRKTRVLLFKGETSIINVPYDEFKKILARNASSTESLLRSISQQIRTPVP